MNLPNQFEMAWSSQDAGCHRPAKGVICTFRPKVANTGAVPMAPNTAGDPWELDGVVHRDEEGNPVLPTPSGQEVTGSEPLDLELPDQWPADPGLPGISDPA
jgi:hypothetical protein